MAKTFLDTSFAIALAMADDAHHARALALRENLKQARNQLLTTSAIVLEIGDGLSRSRYRKTAFAILDFLQQDPSLEIVQLSNMLLENAIKFYRSRPDKEWGLTDCGDDYIATFVVMQERGMTDALTADEHFQQAGFRALLREA